MRRIPTYPEPGLPRALALLFWAALAAIVMAVVVLASPPAQAATLTVTNNEDSGAGSLRQAMIDANSTGSADTIGFGPSLSGQTITLDSQLPLVTAAGGALTIDGGSANVTISGNDEIPQIFEVGNAASLTLNKLTVTRGTSGGILNKGTLKVSNLTISDNDAALGGGGIYNEGVLEVSNSTISGNNDISNDAGGGGIYNADGGVLTVSASTISDNSTTSSGGGSAFAPNGGGIYNGAGSTLTVIDSTISGNEATLGGGIYSDGTMEMSNSTISGNRAQCCGGGMFNGQDGLAKMWNATIAGNRVVSGNTGGGIQNQDGGTTTMWNTIVADNTVQQRQEVWPNCFGDIINGGNNLDSGTTCDFGTANDSLSNTEPKLGPLQDNGGPTETQAISAGSPANNRGNNDFAVDPEGNPLQFDQRGPGFPRIVADTVDIGAFEVQGGLGSEPPPAEVPEDKQACKKGGYEEFGFKNQGQCVKAVNHAS